MKLYLSVFLILVTVLFGVPMLAPTTMAQDIPAPTPEATPAIVQVNVPGTTINVEPANPAPVEPLGGNNGVSVVIGGIILFVVGLFTGRQLGVDKSATLALEGVGSNPQVLAEIRNIYASANDHVQQVVDMLRTVVTAIAPLTPISTDDELARLLATITDKQAAVAALQAVKAQQAAAVVPPAPTPPVVPTP